MAINMIEEWLNKGSVSDATLSDGLLRDSIISFPSMNYIYNTITSFYNKTLPYALLDKEESNVIGSTYFTGIDFLPPTVMPPQTTTSIDPTSGSLVVSYQGTASNTSISITAKAPSNVFGAGTVVLSGGVSLVVELTILSASVTPVMLSNVLASATPNTEGVKRFATDEALVNIPTTINMVAQSYSVTDGNVVFKLPLSPLMSRYAINGIKVSQGTLNASGVDYTTTSNIKNHYANSINQVFPRFIDDTAPTTYLNGLVGAFSTGRLTNSDSKARGIGATLAITPYYPEFVEAGNNRKSFNYNTFLQIGQSNNVLASYGDTMLNFAYKYSNKTPNIASAVTDTKLTTDTASSVTTSDLTTLTSTTLVSKTLLDTYVKTDSDLVKNAQKSTRNVLFGNDGLGNTGLPFTSTGTIISSLEKMLLALVGASDLPKSGLKSSTATSYVPSQVLTSIVYGYKFADSVVQEFSEKVEVKGVKPGESIFGNSDKMEQFARVLPISNNTTTYVLFTGANSQILIGGFPTGGDVRITPPNTVFEYSTPLLNSTTRMPATHPSYKVWAYGKAPRASKLVDSYSVKLIKSYKENMIKPLVGIPIFEGAIADVNQDVLIDRNINDFTHLKMIYSNNGGIKEEVIMLNPNYGLAGGTKSPLVIGYGTPNLANTGTFGFTVAHIRAQFHTYPVGNTLAGKTRVRIISKELVNANSDTITPSTVASIHIASIHGMNLQTVAQGIAWGTDRTFGEVQL